MLDGSSIGGPVVGVSCNQRLRTEAPSSAYEPAEIAAAIREALSEAGLGKKSLAAPLAEIIKAGSTVLLKPNWVLDHNEAGLGMECMVTQREFILAALREVLLARPQRVILGDAPIQLCRWDGVVDEEFRRMASAAAEAAGVRLDIVDFRRTVATTGSVADGVETMRRPLDRYCLLDLGADSLLEPISRPKGRFRVTNYDPRELAKTHSPGRHQYLACREVFEADVILSLPKLKTHRKAGITGALKNLVGINGHKDFLPHHRAGGTVSGGDCYPGRSLRKWWAEFCLDQANKRIGTAAYAFWTRKANRR